MAGQRVVGGVAIAVVGWMAGCGESAPPVAPSPAPAEAVVMRITLEGPSEIGPGTEVQYVVRAHDSLGGAVDVTGQSVLAIEPLQCEGCSEAEVLSVREDGTVRALRVGEAILTAAFGTHRWSKEIIAVPPNSYRLMGMVADLYSGRGTLDDARVVVESAAGRLTTTTSGFGMYRLYGVAGRAAVRVTKTDFEPLQHVVEVTRHSTLDLQLHPLTTRPRATYALEIRAASDCAPVGVAGALPATARERRYTVTLSTTDSRVFGQLSGATFATLSPSAGSGGDAIRGEVEPGGLWFTMTGYENHSFDYNPYPDLVEQIADSQYLVVSGEVHATGGSVLRGMLNGTVAVYGQDVRLEYYVGRVPQAMTSCTSTQHEFTLRKH